MNESNSPNARPPSGLAVEPKAEPAGFKTPGALTTNAPEISFEATLLYGMAADNLDIAARFLRAGLSSNASDHARRALEQIAQGDAVQPKTKPQTALIEV